jgi:hypothetical protein
MSIIMTLHTVIVRDVGLAMLAASGAILIEHVSHQNHASVRQALDTLDQLSQQLLLTDWVVEARHRDECDVLAFFVGQRLH